jgi:hypothetical protein
MCFHSDESDANPSRTFKRMWGPDTRKTMRQRFCHSLTSPSKQSTKVAGHAVTFASELQREDTAILRSLHCNERTYRNAYPSRHMHMKADMNYQPGCNHSAALHIAATIWSAGACSSFTQAACCREARGKAPSSQVSAP